MRDPGEGVDRDGSIVTGVDRRAVPSAYEPLLADLRTRMAGRPAVALYLYGSVATGQARIGVSDVDVLTIDLPAEEAAELGAALSARYATLCRGVEIAPARADELLEAGDPAYGLQVFLRHYCVHLLGPDPSAELPPFPADAQAARGFNGDIGRQLESWRAAARTSDPARLGRRVARKTLLAVAGLVSVLDSTWTTDREAAAVRYPVHRPDLAPELSRLPDWSTGASAADRDTLLALLRPGGLVQQVVDHFRTAIGLWPEPT